MEFFPKIWQSRMLEMGTEKLVTKNVDRSVP